jgi:hypothetical protein
MGNLDAYSRHKEYINNYVNFYGTKKPPEPQQNYKTDVDVLRENWRSPLDPPHTIHARGSDSNGRECARARVLTLSACVGGWARVATDGRQAGEQDVLSRRVGANRFVRDAEDDDGSWEKRLAKKYYDKLFKEYCLADMSR